MTNHMGEGGFLVELSTGSIWGLKNNPVYFLISYGICFSYQQCEIRTRS